MLIKELVLSGYKRMMLNNIQTITYKPESIYQIILGTNGSGKSSILFELSPLPAQSKNYVKGGYKKITFEFNGDTYVATSHFKSGDKHSLLKNGNEELNPGGTQSVQKEIVEQLFKITPDIHKLLIGATHFTNMSAPKRREWITSLCHVDFSYALSVFQRLKTRARDAQGALKHVKQRITGETNKLLTIGNLVELEERYQMLHSELNVLFSERDNQSRPVSTVESELEKCLSDIEKMSTLLVTKLPVIPENKNYTTLQEIDEDLNDCKTELQVNQSLRTRIGTEQSELAELLESLKEAGTGDIEEIKEKIFSLRQERQLTVRRLEGWYELQTDPIVAQKAFYEVSDTLVSILNELPENEDRRFNKERLESSKKEKRDVNLAIEKCNNRIAHFEQKLEHLLTLKEETCPDCGFRWIPGKSDLEQKQYEDDIKQTKHRLKTLLEKENELGTYIEQAEHYSITFSNLKKIIVQYPALKDLWELILSSELLLRNPKEIISNIHSFIHSLEIHANVAGIQERIDYLENIINNAQMKEGEGLRQRLATLNDQMEQITIDIEALTSEQINLAKYRTHVVKYLEINERLENRLNDLDNLYNETVRAYRSDSIESVITSHQNQLSSVQSKRTEKITLEGIIADLEKSKDQLEINNKGYTDLAKALSPVDGLIAEQLTNFIESFVAHLNQVIKSIWSYDLRILPCGLDSGDLDYKFPLYVKHEGESNTAPDITDGSEAQVEVINFAFRLVTMVYLGLENYPVYLDEIGRSFDEQHRSNVMTFIKRLVDTGNYTQLFLISHYAAEFGSFTQAEILVLDSTNITIPQKYNTHVAFE